MLFKKDLELVLIPAHAPELADLPYSVFSEYVHAVECEEQVEDDAYDGARR